MCNKYTQNHAFGRKNCYCYNFQNKYKYSSFTEKNSLYIDLLYVSVDCHQTMRINIMEGQISNETTLFLTKYCHTEVSFVDNFTFLYILLQRLCLRTVIMTNIRQNCVKWNCFTEKLLCLSVFVLKNVLITQQNGFSKDPDDMFSKLFREQMKKEQMTTSHTAMPGTQSTLLNDCPKRGIWRMVHSSHTMGS